MSIYIYVYIYMCISYIYIYILCDYSYLDVSIIYPYGGLEGNNKDNHGKHVWVIIGYLTHWLVT